MKARDTLWVQNDSNLHNLSHNIALYDKYLYMTLEHLLSSIHVVTNEIEANYTERYSSFGDMHYFPDSRILFSLTMEKLTTLCHIIDYKWLCFNRLNSGVLKPDQIDYCTHLLYEAIADDPYITYTDLLALEKDIEIELVLEALIESKKIRYHPSTKRKDKGQNRYLWKTDPISN